MESYASSVLNILKKDKDCKCRFDFSVRAIKQIDKTRMHTNCSKDPLCHHGSRHDYRSGRRHSPKNMCKKERGRKPKRCLSSSARQLVYRSHQRHRDVQRHFGGVGGLLSRTLHSSSRHMLSPRRNQRDTPHTHTHTLTRTRTRPRT